MAQAVIIVPTAEWASMPPKLQPGNATPQIRHRIQCGPTKHIRQRKPLYVSSVERQTSILQLGSSLQSAPFTHPGVPGPLIMGFNTSYSALRTLRALNVLTTAHKHRHDPCGIKSSSQ